MHGQCDFPADEQRLLKQLQRSTVYQEIMKPINLGSGVVRCRCNDSAVIDRLSATGRRDNAAYVRRRSTHRYVRPSQSRTKRRETHSPVATFRRLLEVVLTPTVHIRQVSK